MSAAGDDRLAPRLLGREVPQGADDEPGRGEAVGEVVEPLGDAEVGELGVAARVEEDVGRLDVAVHDAAGVGGAERRQHLGRDPHRLVLGQLSTIGHRLGERRAVDELHHDEQLAVRLAGVEDGDGVRVGEPGRRPRLADEPSHGFRIGRRDAARPRAASPRPGGPVAGRSPVHTGEPADSQFVFERVTFSQHAACPDGTHPTARHTAPPKPLFCLRQIARRRI